MAFMPYRHFNYNYQIYCCVNSYVGWRVGMAVICNITHADTSQLRPVRQGRSFMIGCLSSVLKNKWAALLGAAHLRGGIWNSKAISLLQAEGNGEVVGYTYGLAVVTTGSPLRHLGYNALCLCVEGGVLAAYHVYAGDAAVLFYDELYGYLTLDTFFRSGCRINDVIAEPLVHCCVAAGERRLLLNHCYVDRTLFFGLLNNGLFNHVFLYDFLTGVFLAFVVRSAKLCGVVKYLGNVFYFLVLFNFLHDGEFGNGLGGGNLLLLLNLFGFGKFYLLFFFFLFHLFG